MNYDGKGFEEIILYRAREVDEPAHRYTLGRYGVMAAFIKGVWTPINSLPDFEGNLASGQGFIFDCKTCSQASYALTGGTSKSFNNQYRHLRRRAPFNVLTFLLMHWNARTMKAGKVDPWFTVILPVDDSSLWQSYDRGEQHSISRAEAKLYGIPVDWNIPDGKQTMSPDLYAGLLALKARKVDILPGINAGDSRAGSNVLER